MVADVRRRGASRADLALLEDRIEEGERIAALIQARDALGRPTSPEIVKRLLKDYANAIDELALT